MNTCDEKEIQALAFSKYEEGCVPFNPDDLVLNTHHHHWFEHKRHNFTLTGEMLWVTHTFVHITKNKVTSSHYKLLVKNEELKKTQRDCLKLQEQLSSLIKPEPIVENVEVKPWWKFWERGQ